MSEQNLPLPGARNCNPWIKSMIGGEFVKIVSMDVYPCGDSCSKPVGTNIVKISEANYRDNPDLCMKIVVEALLSLPVRILYDCLPYRTAALRDGFLRWWRGVRITSETVRQRSDQQHNAACRAAHRD